ncbi:peptidyl-prolyl cis-trans isomerase FKBP4-like [Mya arenaria]|uniref:peptidyl-prolyl cis-trans isomerase FKBP4-like n=1 Tax=Mya arenaria TaxID=6604 RepID=UPI0022E6DD2B|nr:peptidyl-prolyl cis-trans isomerase FKBP4-like [Mya arenaria]
MAVVFDLKRCTEACNLKVGESADLSPFKDKGIVKELLTQGIGGEYPDDGDKVFFKYTAYLGDKRIKERIFDSTEKDGKPFEYECLKGKVIRGFELAVLTMKPGERSLIHIKPEYGFGKSGAPPRVPADTDILFDTEIIKVECADISTEQDKSVQKKVLVRGKGFLHTNYGCPVEIHIKGKCGKRVFLDKDVKFNMGEGSSEENGLPPFIERYLEHWKIGEEARVSFKARQAYGEAGCEKYKIGPNKDLTFWIHMKTFERVKEYWEMDYKEKMDKSVEYKEMGNKYFKKGEYQLASTIYEEMLDYVEHDLCMEGENEERRRDLVVVGNLNLAQAYLKVGKNSKARDCCDKALTFDGNNIKAYYRRGMANFADGEYETAKEDFQKVLEVEPQHKPAKDQIDKCIIKMAEKPKSDRELARKMMSGIGKQFGDNGSRNDGS